VAKPIGFGAESHFARRPDTISIALFLSLAIALGSAWARFAETHGLLNNPNTAGLAAWTAQLSVALAVFVTSFVRTRESLRKAGWHWGPLSAYAGVALVTAAVVGCVWAISIGLHALVFTPHVTARQLAISLPFILVLSCLFAFAEELGWRGFLLPKLLPVGARRALLVSGVCWFLWELPLVAFGVLYSSLIQINLPLTLALHFLTTISIGVLFGYLRLRFDSIALPTFAHGFLNTMGAISFLFFTEKRPFLGDFGGLIGTALVVLIACMFMVARKASFPLVNLN
jgi:membrane protease YdiL (CAAX protease family)